MHARLNRAIVPAAAIAWVAVPSAAGAAVCGDVDQQSSQPVRGTLVLKDDQSTVTKNYRDGSGDHRMRLVYGVDGCTLSSSARPPVVEMGASGASGKDFPADAITFDPVTLDDPKELTVDFTVHLDDLDAGTYSGMVEVRAPSYLGTTRSLVAVSRSSSPLTAIGLGALGALLGIFWAWVQTSSTKVPKPKVRDVVILVGVGAVAGIGAGWGAWKAQDVWVLHDNWWTAGVGGFTAATTGALVGVATAFFGGGAGGEDGGGGAGGGKPVAEGAPI